MNRHLDHNWAKVIRNNKTKYHPLIDSKKKRTTNQNLKQSTPIKK